MTNIETSLYIVTILIKVNNVGMCEVGMLDEFQIHIIFLYHN